MAACATPATPISPAPLDVEQVRNRALTWLQAQELADGGFGDSRGEISANTTSTVLAVLATLPADDVSNFRPAAAVEAMSPVASDWLADRDSGFVAKALLGVAAGGEDGTDFAGLDLLAELDAAYDASTGLFHPESLYRHLLAIQGLIAVGAPVPAPAVEVVGRLQQADGGWTWRMAADVTPNGASDVDTTAQVLLTLADVGVQPDDPRIAGALDFLTLRQTAEGGWAMDADAMANANSTGLVLTALGRLGLAESPPASIRADQAQRWLADLQQPDGSFHYTADLPGAVLMATLDALPAFMWHFNTESPE